MQTRRRREMGKVSLPARINSVVNILAHGRIGDYFYCVSTVTEIKQAVSKLPARKKQALARWLNDLTDDRLTNKEMMDIAAEGARALDQRERAYAKGKAR